MGVLLHAFLLTTAAWYGNSFASLCQTKPSSVHEHNHSAKQLKKEYDQYELFTLLCRGPIGDDRGQLTVKGTGVREQ